jgi:ribonuclease BN (tRNA processing enzyme)
MLRDADLAVLDTMFTPAEIMEYHGYGHSSWQDVARICAASHVASWRLFHHAPSLTDSALDAIEAELRREFPDSGAAREGDLYVL